MCPCPHQGRQTVEVLLTGLICVCGGGSAERTQVRFAAPCCMHMHRGTRPGLTESPGIRAQVGQIRGRPLCRPELGSPVRSVGQPLPALPSQQPKPPPFSPHSQPAHAKWFSEANLGPPEEQQALLTAELSTESQFSQHV